ncbi:glycosyltransferase [Tundrisphaera sp. TA3]|uniref:glycosyltransferase n=1 Tax=Tundrisphaera sp. TA3 TaxID=3435775 RepID=UPI003EBC8B0A
MHILFVHQNFPAQFGHIASYLARHRGDTCTFVTHQPAGEGGGVRRVHYEPMGGAKATNHYCTRTFENAVAHAHGVYEACKTLDRSPDLIVGHSGFGSTLFLRELFDCPIINYFEYFYRPSGSDLDFRPEHPPEEKDRLRSYARNAMILLDLENCDAGYSPTRWQRSLLPEAFREKVRTIFDGIDTSIWRRREGLAREVGGRRIEPGTRIVTYVSRGFESMRGFDVFMKVAKKIYQARPDVVFLVVGEDRVAYGGDLKRIKEQSFREHVLASDDYDLSRFIFTGRVPPNELAEIISLGDLHIYLTVPFVLSWSLFNALACGATVLASDTAPVRELIHPDRTGILADFHDADGLARRALQVLEDPSSYRHLGEAGVELIAGRYSLDRTLPLMLELYDGVLQRGAARGLPSGDPG